MGTGILKNDILFVTPYRESNSRYDYWGQNVKRKIRYHYYNDVSYGLRFLKKNIPDIKILEYPSYKRYVEELKKGYDIVGFSFYTHDVPKIKKMVKKARELGVKEIWGGNYGVLTYGVDDLFDKIYIGYGEEWVADQLGKTIDRIKHPIITGSVSLPIGIGAFPVGILFTSRGCTNRCAFCQTPVFCDSTSAISLESTEEIIKNYSDLGINQVLIPDETFGLHKKHSEKVIRQLDSHGFTWYPMTRIDFLDNRIDHWYEKGLGGAFLGVESLRQSSLDNMGKSFDTEQTERVLEKFEELDLFTVAYYIIGFEDDTEETIKMSVRNFNEFSIDMLQVCILTPLPRTELWDKIEEKYGIVENDWSKWDTKHLVWDHPNFSPKEMAKVLEWCFRKGYPNKRFLQTPRKFFSLYMNRAGSIGLFKKIITDWILANTRFAHTLPP